MTLASKLASTTALSPRIPQFLLSSKFANCLSREKYSPKRTRRSTRPRRVAVEFNLKISLQLNSNLSIGKEESVSRVSCQVTLCTEKLDCEWNMDIIAGNGNNSRPPSVFPNLFVPSVTRNILIPSLSPTLTVSIRRYANLDDKRVINRD